MSEFFRTQMGRKLLDGDIPKNLPFGVFASQ